MGSVSARCASAARTVISLVEGILCVCVCAVVLAACTFGVLTTVW